MERCDCEVWQCLAERGELPHDQKCVEERKNYCPSMDYDIRPLHYFQVASDVERPTAFIELMVEDSKGG